MTEGFTSGADLLPVGGSNAWLVEQGLSDANLAEIVQGLGQNLGGGAGSRCKG